MVTSNARGTVVTRSMLNVQDYPAEWLETTRSKLRTSTHHSYAMAVDRINAHLGRYQLQTLTPLQIERFYTEHLASGGRDGRPLAPNGCGTLTSSCERHLPNTERLGLVPRNAAAAARDRRLRKNATWSRGPATTSGPSWQRR